MILIVFWRTCNTSYNITGCSVRSHKRLLKSLLKMIIFLSELQKEHLKLINQHSTQVLVDFCKLSIDFLNNGINEKKFQLAADKLDVSTPVIVDLIHAIVFLLIEGAKHNLAEVDFKSSLAIAGFSAEQQEVLTKLYVTKKNDIAESLQLLLQTDLTYQDLKWRFEIQVASSNSSEEVKPTVLMDFILTKPKKISETKNFGFDKKKTETTSLYIENKIEDAKSASECQNVVSHSLLQCDLPNLLHMTNSLEQALKESKSQHVRKVQRAIQ